jgi:hypothetical protein
MLALLFYGGNALHDSVLKTTLYIKQSFAKDQRTLGDGTVIINWPIKDGPGAAANTIGHAEGLTTLANEPSHFWVTWSSTKGGNTYYFVCSWKTKHFLV